MSHWTQQNAKDFAYHLSLDFFTQLQDRFEESDLLRKEFAEKVRLSAGRISQIFNSPPSNPKVDSLVRYAQALGLKVAIVAYDDSDPTNDRGPVFSGVIAKCWEKMGRPRDLSAFAVNSDKETVDRLESGSFNVLGSQEKKSPQSAQRETAGGELNMVDASCRMNISKKRKIKIKRWDRPKAH
jgi:transcriptional regulator with XRE-family HTH domain